MPGKWFPVWIGSQVLLFIVAFFIPWLFLVALITLLGLLVLLVLEGYFLFFKGKLEGERQCTDRFSNGDPNPVVVIIRNLYPLSLEVEAIDELPPQFQDRNFSIQVKANPDEEVSHTYRLRPVERGEYHFGQLNLFAHGPAGLLVRKFVCAEPRMVAVYPSFLQMRKYQLMAVTDRLAQVGVRKLRRLGNTSEFEQIREYVQGDDYRTINWKASGRRGHVMVNQYRDERAQNIYCLIDKSRSMVMPFEGMTLLDYAINATLVLSNIALYRQDKAGLLTFSEKITHFLPASSRTTQMEAIMETLYNQTTGFLEADYDRLYAYVNQRIAHRSLLVLFSNFETFAGMERQWPALARLAKRHLLVVIFFENTELYQLTEMSPDSLEDIYLKAIGEQFMFEKRRIVRELEQLGIHAVLTTPKSLTVNALNKYLELKSRGLI